MTFRARNGFGALVGDPLVTLAGFGIFPDDAGGDSVAPSGTRPEAPMGVLSPQTGACFAGRACPFIPGVAGAVAVSVRVG